MTETKRGFHLPIWLCIVVSLVLVVFGLVYGTVSGYSDDRAQVDALLEGESGLLNVVDYRAADGLNLCVVAGRHLAGDADVEALKSAANALRVEKATLTERKTADAALAEAFAKVTEKLRASESFAQSARDQNYLSRLTADLNQLSQSGIFGTYNAAATDFNQKLQKPVSGFIAGLLGVKPCELY